MIEFEKLYHRNIDPGVFQHLPESMQSLCISRHENSELYSNKADAVFLAVYGEDQNQRLWIEIKDNYIQTDLSNGSCLKTQVIPGWTTEKNVHVFFYRYLSFVNDYSELGYKEEYIFKREKEPNFFTHFDQEVHTLAIKSVGERWQKIRIKYIKRDSIGSLEFLIQDKKVVCTDRRYPYAFTFQGTHPKFEDLARIASNVIRCIQALNESPEQETA